MKLYYVVYIVHMIVEYGGLKKQGLRIAQMFHAGVKGINSAVFSVTYFW